MITVPAAFKKYKQFIVYKIVPKDNGKFDKIPFNPTGYDENYSHLKPEYQMTFEEACAHAERLNQHVGFVFTENDPFFFLDIDHGYNFKSKQWHTIANNLVSDMAGAFIEVSYSGDGLHIFGTGEPGDDYAHKYKNGDGLELELYHRDRFVALTGTHANGCADTYVNGKLQEVINRFFTRTTVDINSPGWTDKPRDDWDGITDDDELINKMISTTSAASALLGRASAADLWNKNVEILADSYPDDKREFNESDADAALAQHLAFWTGCDCERMVRLMWRSNLVREKWTKHKKYLKITIENAVSKQKEVYNKGGKKCDNWIERIEEEAPNPKLVQTLIKDLKNANLNRNDREMLASMIADRTKESGHGISKSILKQSLEIDYDSRIGFTDVKASGKPKATVENLKNLLDYYKVKIRYNLMSKEVEIAIPGASYTVDNAENCAIADLRSLCNRHDLPPSCVDDYVRLLGDENAYNPPRDWILSKSWDGVDRIDALVATLGAKRSAMVSILLRRYLISGVAALFNPDGLSAGGMIVLQGPQYAGKTRWLRRLFYSTQWFKEGVILNPHDKDSVKQAVSCWGAELGELDATFKRSDIAALKGFLTKDQDEFRLPYERRASKFPRRTVFGGSVNPKDYLHDDTGNRRFWTIEVTNLINPDHQVDIQQVWAQAYSYYQNGEKWYLTRDENKALNDHNEDFSTIDPMEDKILQMYDLEKKPNRPMTITEIASEMGIERPTRKEINELSRAIQKTIDCEPRKSNGRRVVDMPPTRLMSEFLK